VLFLYYYFIN